MPRVFFLLLTVLSCIGAASALAMPVQPAKVPIDNARTLFLKALELQQNGHNEAAARQYRQLIKRYPALPEPRNNLAMIYLQQGKYDQAIDTLVATLNTHPAYATAWSNLKTLYQGLASEAYRKALSKEKSPRSVMDNLKLSALTDLYQRAVINVRQQPIKPANAVSSDIRLASKSTSSTVAPASSRATPAVTQRTQAAPQPPVVAAPSTTQDSATLRPDVKKSNIEPPPDNRQSAISHIKNWAQTWSRKDFAGYVNAYLASYKGAKHSHQTWVDYRRSRIVKPGFIRVEVDRFKVKSLSSTRAIIDFRQRFTSTNYKDRVIKRIYLSKTPEGWKISREKTLAVLK